MSHYLKIFNSIWNLNTMVHAKKITDCSCELIHSYFEYVYCGKY